MAQLEFCDKHNMVAYLVKSASSEGFDEIIDFITSSHIYYTLTENPIIFVSLIEQFWETVVLSTTEEGLQAISATIDGHEKLITEDSLRRHLKLDDAEGISSLSNEEIFEHLAHMGYVTNSESLTFFKGPMKHLSLKSYNRQRQLMERQFSPWLKGVIDSEKSIKKKHRRESMKMKEKSTNFVTPTKALREAQEEDISPTILEAAKTFSKVASQEVSTGSTKVDSGTASKRGQREGKAPMVEEDIQATHKTKEQIR
ncbi:hypothetical protein Tco_0794362 [Tanacetum coccineum]